MIAKEKKTNEEEYIEHLELAPTFLVYYFKKANRKWNLSYYKNGTDTICVNMN